MTKNSSKKPTKSTSRTPKSTTRSPKGTSRPASRPGKSSSRPSRPASRPGSAPRRPAPQEPVSTAIVNKKTQQVGELVYGVNPVTELLKAKRRKVISIYTTKPGPKAWPEIERLLPQYPINIQYVEREVLHRIAGSTDHQGILAWAQPIPYRKKPFDPKKQKSILMLDGIQDARNLGAILRSAYCTGIDGVVIVKKNSAQINAASLKASAGLAEYLELSIAPSAVAAAQELTQAGYNLYLATFDGENAATCAYKSPSCIVIGGEGYGISKEILGFGTKVTLPQRSPDISYNASVAAGILLFLTATQQSKI